MRRRDVLAAASMAPSLALAQAASRAPPRVGVLLWGSPDREIYLRPFLNALKELGYDDGRNIALELRWARGDSGRAAASLAELVSLRPDLIVANTTPVAHEAKRVTATIPIVMAPVADALATGLVASMSRPGGNVTGVSSLAPDLGGKRLDLARELLPSLARAAFLGSSRDPNTQTHLREAEVAALSSGIELRAVLIGGADDLDGAFDNLARAGSEAVIIQPILLDHRLRIAELAIRHRLPTVGSLRPAAEDGMLISFGASLAELMRQAAGLVDRILKGAKPGDLPVEQPTRFELVVNLRTARTLGIAIPPTLIARADEVIE